jgi:fructose-1,6-bisphosphatase I
MSAAIYAVYGPKTTLVVSTGKGVHEFLLTEDGYLLTRENIKINLEGKYFAPGNLRACNTESWYKQAVNFWISEQYTLRYSGGMVPDINHIFVKGGGVFVYPGTSSEPKGKLRLLYECGPMAFLVTQAGGYASDGNSDILDLEIQSLHQRSPIIIGSRVEVEKTLEIKNGN